jgi:hypothetical protein
MISKLFDAMFTPKYPRGYTGRHRAEFALVGAAKPSLARAKALVGREATI